MEKGVYTKAAVEFFKGVHSGKSAGIRRSQAARQKITQDLPFLDQLDTLAASASKSQAEVHDPCGFFSEKDTEAIPHLGASS